MSTVAASPDAAQGAAGSLDELDASLPEWLVPAAQDSDAGAWVTPASDEEWTRTFGGSYGDSPVRVLFDGSRILVAGSMPQDPQASHLPPPDVWTDRGGFCFIAAFELDGSLRWGYRHESCSQTDYPDIAVLPDGRVLATYEEWFRNEGGTPYAFGAETTLFELDESGAFEWGRTFDSGGGELLLRAGPRLAAFDDGSYVLLSHRHAGDAPRESTLTRFSSDGEEQTYALPSSKVSNIAPTRSGDLLVLATVDWEEGKTALCLDRLSPSFETVWSGCLSGERWDFYTEGVVRELASGQLAMTASPTASAGTLNLNRSTGVIPIVEPTLDKPLTSPSTLLLVLEPDGNPIWTQAFSASAVGVALDEGRDGALYLGGRFSGPSSFLGVNDASVIGGAYVAKFGTGGEFMGARTWDGELRGLATGPDDTLVAVGSFDRGVDFGSGERVDYRTPLGTTDGFVMRFPWRVQNRVLTRAPAQCNTLEGSSLPLNFEACEAAGFSSYRSQDGPTCHAGWCYPDPLFAECKARGGGISIVEGPTSTECCDVIYPQYDCPCLGNWCD
jgi:hypothetical protein